jgi:hypothetical protein
VTVRDKINPKKDVQSVTPEGTVTWTRPAESKPGDYLVAGTEVVDPTCTLVAGGIDSSGRAFATCSVDYVGEMPGRHALAVDYTAKRTDPGVFDRAHQDLTGTGEAPFRPRPPATIEGVTPGAQTLIVEWTPSIDESFLIAAPDADAPVNYVVTAILPTVPATLDFPVAPGVAGGSFDDGTGRYTFEADTLDVVTAVCMRVETVYEGLSSDDGTLANLRQDCSGIPDGREVEMEVECETVFVDSEATCTATLIDVINPAKTEDPSSYAPTGEVDWERRDTEAKLGTFGDLDDGLFGGLGTDRTCVLVPAEGTRDGLAYSTCTVTYHSATVGWHLLKTTGYRPAGVDRGDGLVALPLHDPVTDDILTRAGFDYRVTLSGQLAKSGGVRTKAGSVVPLTFRLTTAHGVPVTDLRAVEIYMIMRTCPNGLPTDVQRAAASTPLAVFFPGKSGLLNLGRGNYQLNLKTDKSLANACVVYSLGFGDASTPAQPDPPDEFGNPRRAQLVEDEVIGSLGQPRMVPRQYQLFMLTR